MAFNSIEYAVFLALVVGLYWRLPHRGQNWLLLAASYFFYGCWDWRFLSLIAFSTAVDYRLGLEIAETSDAARRKRLVTISLVTNLGLLGVFKYFGFFAESFADLLGTMGIAADWRLIRIVLPVGISFYTFQTLSYTIDIYRGTLAPAKKFTDFALFVAFFPQLVAGPIERASHLLPLILAKRKFAWDHVGRGAYLILLGLFKKVVIADGLAPSVDQVFRAGSGVGGGDIWIGSALFALQIYGDFSGYTDIARGSSKMLGIDILQNFRSPYFSSSPQEFWRRWHISLSTWLRDYLYISLGGNRSGPIGTYRNLALTMILGGLWHGAAWNFVFWGFYQGILLATHRAVVAVRPPTKSSLLTAVKIVFFFGLTCYGWMLFRAESMGQCLDFTIKMVSEPLRFVTGVERPALATIAGIPLLIAIDVFQFTSGKVRFYSSWPPAARGLLFAMTLWLLVMGLTNAPSEFIYFQF